MPELIEVESYRTAADRLVGSRITRVECADDRYLRHTVDLLALRSVLEGARLTDVGRHGKVMLLGTDRGHALGVRFGMTGRLSVDGYEPITELRYGPSGTGDGVRRFGIGTTAGAAWVLDPRRLGSVELDPDLTVLGPDAASLRVDDLRPALRSSRALKAVLLDQQSVAGLGNLLVDESLWRAGLAPGRPAESLGAAEQVRLVRTVVRTVAQLTRRGGSHTGDLQEARDARGACPRCGAALAVDRIGGRTTIWCPGDQR